MVKGIDREGTLFLTSCRETTANLYTHAALLKEDSLAVIAEKNRNNNLDWHSGVIFYKKGVVYFYDPRFAIESEEFKWRVLQFKFRARLMDFISNNQGIPINQIFVGGDNMRGNCRKKSLSFIQDVVNGVKLKKACETVLFYEFKKGPRKPNLDMLEGPKFIPVG